MYALEISGCGTLNLCKVNAPCVRLQRGKKEELMKREMWFSLREVSVQEMQTATFKEAFWVFSKYWEVYGEVCVSKQNLKAGFVFWRPKMTQKSIITQSHVETKTGNLPKLEEQGFHLPTTTCERYNAWIKMSWRLRVLHICAPQTNPALWGFPPQQQSSHHRAGMLSFAPKPPMLDIRISHESASPWFSYVPSWPSTVSSRTFSEAVASAAAQMNSWLSNTAQCQASTHVPELCLTQTFEAGRGNLVVIWKHTYL